MRKATIALLAGLGLAAIAGAAQAGEGGCAWERSAKSQTNDAPSTQAGTPAPTRERAS